MTSYGLSFLGGAIIGLAASLFLLLHGRVAGIAGLFAGSFLPRSEARVQRILFVVGLFAAAPLAMLMTPRAASSPTSIVVVAVAGLLVGFGTRLGNGCTSGHGVCGMSRLSARSIVATLVFMGAAMVTVFVVRHVLGGGAQ
jgi:uncharacterized membrane protein YedE/YeeE